MTSERVRIVIADDHPVYRDGLARAIDQRTDLELIGTAANGWEALQALRERTPDVALVDVRMPGLLGHDVVKAVEREGLSTRVVLLSAHADSPDVMDAIAAGAAGYVSKGESRERICDVLVATANGQAMLSDELQGGLLREIRVRNENEGRVLSRRETQVLDLVSDGLSGPAIGERLHLSPTTVKSHLRSVYRKLGVADRAAAVAEAMRRGLLQ